MGRALPGPYMIQKGRSGLAHPPLSYPSQFLRVTNTHRRLDASPHPGIVAGSGHPELRGRDHHQPDPQVTVEAVPVVVQQLAGNNSDHFCALNSDGTVFCWGSNEFGQVGDGSTTHRLVPVQVTGGHRFKPLFAGRTITCGIDINDTTRCWGRGTDEIGRAHV